MVPQGNNARKLTPGVGAVDLSGPLDEGTFTGIRDCPIENGVIFFRNERLTPDAQKDFDRRFGKRSGHRVTIRGDKPF